MEMTSPQNARECALDLLQRGEITAAQANVLMIQIEGVRVVHKLPADVRRALNEAVKAGELGHIKKDGLRPEVYYHKNARPRAIEIRNEIHRNALGRLSKVFTNE